MKEGKAKQRLTVVFVVNAACGKAAGQVHVGKKATSLH